MTAATLPTITEADIAHYVGRAVATRLWEKASRKADAVTRETGVPEGLNPKEKRQWRTRLTEGLLPEFEPLREELTNTVRDQTLAEWNLFVQEYTENGQNAQRVHDVTLLRDLAFRGGMHAWLASQTSAGVDDQKFTLQLAHLNDACTAQSARTKDKPSRALNNILVVALVDQWTTLKADSRFGDQPPLTKQTKTKNEKAHIKRFCQAVLATQEGKMLHDALFCLNHSYLQGTLSNLSSKKRFFEHYSGLTRDALTSEAADVFTTSLFNFSPENHMSFSNFFITDVTWRLPRRLHKHYVADAPPSAHEVGKWERKPKSSARSFVQLVDLDSPNASGGLERFADPNAEDPAEMVTRRELPSWLINASLSPHERELVNRYHGIGRSSESFLEILPV